MAHLVFEKNVDGIPVFDVTTGGHHHHHDHHKHHHGHAAPATTTLAAPTMTYAAPAVSTVAAAAPAISTVAGTSTSIVGGVGGGSVTHGAAGGSFGGASGAYTSTGSAGFVGGVGGGSVTYGAAGGSLGGAAVMGGPTQMTMAASISTGSAAGTFTEYAPTTTTTRETGAPVYVSGAATEVMGSAVVNTVHKEQVVAGSVSQNVGEIPTVQFIGLVQEIPEVQTVEREIVQKVQR